MNAEIRRLLERLRDQTHMIANATRVIDMEIAAALLPALPPDDPPAYMSGSTHPEFEVWWARFGEPLMGDSRLYVRDIAMSAWAAADYRAREFARLTGRTPAEDEA